MISGRTEGWRSRGSLREIREAGGGSWAEDLFEVDGG